jgi:hypothetical protein
MGGPDGYDPGNRYGDGEYSSLTVTQGRDKNGQWVWTVTSSRNGTLTFGEQHRAAEIFGMDGFAMPESRMRIDRRTADWHSEQRGIRATHGQADRRQATSNITPDTKAGRDVLHVGAACDGCADAQVAAGVRNVTGTVRGGGRTNNPSPVAWMQWRDKWRPPPPPPPRHNKR